MQKKLLLFFIAGFFKYEFAPSNLLSMRFLNRSKEISETAGNIKH